MYKHQCKKCGNTEAFYVKAIIMQEWFVDGQGDFSEVFTECMETVSPSDIDNEWICANCGSTDIEHIKPLFNI